MLSGPYIDQPSRRRAAPALPAFFAAFLLVAAFFAAAFFAAAFFAAVFFAATFFVAAFFTAAFVAGFFATDFPADARAAFFAGRRGAGSAVCPACDAGPASAASRSR